VQLALFRPHLVRCIPANSKVDVSTGALLHLPMMSNVGYLRTAYESAHLVLVRSQHARASYAHGMFRIKLSLLPTQEQLPGHKESHAMLTGFAAKMKPKFAESKM
jgi:hypothetical protein